MLCFLLLSLCLLHELELAENTGNDVSNIQSDDLGATRVDPSYDSLGHATLTLGSMDDGRRNKDEKERTISRCEILVSIMAMLANIALNMFSAIGAKYSKDIYT
jgi:hypothetical protein